MDIRTIIDAMYFEVTFKVDRPNAMPIRAGAQIGVAEFIANPSDTMMLAATRAALSVATLIETERGAKDAGQ